MQQVGAAAWQHGAGAGLQQETGLQHLTLGCLQHLTLAGLQQWLLASAEPLNAARTANVAQNATNFKTRLIDVSLFQLSMGWSHWTLPSWRTRDTLVAALSKTIRVRHSLDAR